MARKSTKKKTASKSGKSKKAVSKPRASKTAKKRKTVSRKEAAPKRKKRVLTKKTRSTKAKIKAKAATRKKTTQPRKPRAPEAEKKPMPARGRGDARATRERRKVKILTRDFLQDLAAAIRTAVLPSVREAKGREVVGAASSGDATFEIDRVAEKALLAFLRNARLPIAYYSEDAGYSTFTSGQPQNLLVVDPIDGTRAAKSGFEGCVVSVASTRVIERPCIADVDNACVMEILGDRTFYAERGKGVRIVQGEHTRRVKLSKNTDLETLSWSMTVPARPAELIFQTAAKLVDLTSLKGGFFACNSTSFSLTRLITNQLDACVDIANRFLRDIPDIVRDQFINAGRGMVLGIAPYDIAASLLIAIEAGCTVTDAYGESFDEVLLLDSSVDNHRSLIAAANPELHGMLLKYFDTRISQLEGLLKSRAEQVGQ